MAETKEFLEAYLPCFLNGAGITIVLSLITVSFFINTRYNICVDEVI